MAKVIEVVGRKDDGYAHDGPQKLRWDLLPVGPIEGIVQVLTFGAAKYGANDWRHVENAEERYYAAGMRHLMEDRKGNRLDPETGLPHLYHAMCCFTFIDELRGNTETAIAKTTAKLTLSHLIAALDQFPTYQAINVFADDLVELRERPLQALHQLDAQGRIFAFQDFSLELFPVQGVAKLSRAATAATGVVSGAIVEGLIEVAIDAAEKSKKGLDGLFLGLLVGASSHATISGTSRVFALTFDLDSAQWHAYDGGLLRWMKKSLHV